MVFNSKEGKRIAALHGEIHSIHRANMLFWRKGKSQSRDARAEHARRQIRLQTIRAKLADYTAANILNVTYITDKAS